jgi:signal transduction histidine kinase
MKIVQRGFISFNEADGLGHTRIVGISEDPAGGVLVKSGLWFINRFDGKRFTAAQPNILPPLTADDWNFTQICLRDHAGEWWVPTRSGLYRFPKVDRIEQLSRARPKAVYTTRDGLSHNFISYMFEDARGDIWMGTGGLAWLTRWERATNTFHGYSDAQGMSLPSRPQSFCEDGGKNLWIGFSDRVARYRDGQFRFWTAADGYLKGGVRSLYLDRELRLWVATGLNGLIRIDDPTDQEPRFKSYTIADGLASNNVRCITEDAWGRIYAGLGRGVDRLDPATGQIMHYNTDDGLANSFVNEAFRDSQGHLWFGMLQGLSRLIPEPDRPAAPPPVRINALRIAGDIYPVSELGVTELSLPALKAGQNRIRIEFYGLSFSSGGALRYQHMLEGVDRDWSAPSDQRAFDASLAAGQYRFLVRAINANGLASAKPAVVSFTILPPLWKRWWFITLMGLISAAVVFAYERYRVARLIELERVRMRIATDLHDDIGAGLSRIAILSEVAHGRLGTGDLRGRDHMMNIAASSRELLDSMSDIVWAINPQKESLKDLIQRMRRFASDLLTGRDIAFRFNAPEGDQDLKLGADMRREVFLIYKESVNNLARHSGATAAEIDLKIDRRRLTLEIKDNGRGFDADSISTGAGRSEGNGLTSMRNRARRLGGELQITSSPGQGASIILRAPIQPHWWVEKQPIEGPRRRKGNQKQNAQSRLSSILSRLNKRRPL